MEGHGTARVITMKGMGLGQEDHSLLGDNSPQEGDVVGVELVLQEVGQAWVRLLHWQAGQAL